MSYPSISLAYRKAAVQQASPEALAMALLDTLITDLQHAIQAIHRQAIEARSNALKHGFRVLGQLHTLLRPGTPAASSLAGFYEHLRRQMLAAQFRPEPSTLMPLIQQILKVRSALEQVNRRQESTQATEGGFPACDEEVSTLSLRA